MSSSHRIDVRVEDLLVATAAIALGVTAGVATVARSITLDQSAYWQFSYFAFPIAILTFATAVRFAFRSSETMSVAVPLRRAATILRDWLPFLLFLGLYESFQSRLWQDVHPALRDPALLRIDRALFGETPAFVLQHFEAPWLTAILAICYFLHLVLPAVLGTLLYIRDRQTFRAFLLTVLIAAIIGFAGYAAVPAVGPGSYYPDAFSHPLGGSLQAEVLQIVDAARAPRDVFPSLHVAISTLVLLFARRAGRFWFWLMLPLVVGNWIATIYLRYHYLIDVLAGWAAAAAAYYLAGLLLRLERRWREPVV